MNRLNLCPRQDSYSVKFGCSAQRSELRGGFSRYVMNSPSKRHKVSIAYTLTEEDYLYFRAFYLNWQRHPLPFLMKLIIEDSEYKDYICQFVSDSFSFSELNAKVFSVSAELLVVISPVVVLTSKTYPLYLVESVASDMALVDVTQRDIMHSNGLEEEVSTQFAMTGATQRTAYNVYPPQDGSSANQSVLDNVSTSFAMTSAVRWQPLQTVSANTEALTTQFAMTGATQKAVLITTTAPIEQISTQFAMTGATITS